MKTAAGLQRFCSTMGNSMGFSVRYQDQVQGLLGKAGRYSPKRLEFRNPKKTLGCFSWDTSRSRFLPRWICKCKWCCRYGDSRFCLWDCESKTGLNLWCWGHWCHRSLRQCRDVAKYQHLHLQVLTVFWEKLVVCQKSGRWFARITAIGSKLRKFQQKNPVKDMLESMPCHGFLDLPSRHWLTWGLSKPRRSWWSHHAWAKIQIWGISMGIFSFSGLWQI